MKTTVTQRVTSNELKHRNPQLISPRTNSRVRPNDPTGDSLSQNLRSIPTSPGHCGSNKILSFGMPSSQNMSKPNLGNSILMQNKKSGQYDAQASPVQQNQDINSLKKVNFKQEKQKAKMKMPDVILENLNTARSGLDSGTSGDPHASYVTTQQSFNSRKILSPVRLKNMTEKKQYQDKFNSYSLRAKKISEMTLAPINIKPQRHPFLDSRDKASHLTTFSPNSGACTNLLVFKDKQQSKRLSSQSNPLNMEKNTDSTVSGGISKALLSSQKLSENQKKLLQRQLETNQIIAKTQEHVKKISQRYNKARIEKQIQQQKIQEQQAETYRSQIRNMVPDRSKDSLQEPGLNESISKIGLGQESHAKNQSKKQSPRRVLSLNTKNMGSPKAKFMSIREEQAEGENQEDGRQTPEVIQSLKKRQHKLKRYEVLPQVQEFIKDQEINNVAVNLSMDFKSISDTMNSINFQDGMKLNQSMVADQNNTLKRKQTNIITSVPNTNTTNSSIGLNQQPPLLKQQSLAAGKVDANTLALVQQNSSLQPLPHTAILQNQLSPAEMVNQKMQLVTESHQKKMVSKNLLQDYITGPQNMQDNHKFHGNIFQRGYKTMTKQTFGSKKEDVEKIEEIQAKDTTIDSKLDQKNMEVAFKQNPLLPKIYFAKNEVDNSIAIQQTLRSITSYPDQTLNSSIDYKQSPGRLRNIPQTDKILQRFKKQTPIYHQIVNELDKTTNNETLVSSRRRTIGSHVGGKNRNNFQNLNNSQVVIENMHDSIQIQRFNRSNDSASVDSSVDEVNLMSFRENTEESKEYDEWQLIRAFREQRNAKASKRQNLRLTNPNEPHNFQTATSVSQSIDPATFNSKGFGLARRTTSPTSVFNPDASIDSFQSNGNWASNNMIQSVSNSILTTDQQTNRKRFDDGNGTALPYISPMTAIENQFLQITNEILMQELIRQEQQIDDKSKDEGQEQNSQMSSANLLKLNPKNLEKKMVGTKQEVMQALHELKRLLLNKDKIHTQIQAMRTYRGKLIGEEVSDPLTSVQMLSNTDFFFKVDIEEFTQSPVVVKLFMRDEKRFIAPENIMVYGSFSNRMPSYLDNELLVKGPKRLLIYEPNGQKIFKTDCRYYINIVSYDDYPRNIYLKSNHSMNQDTSNQNGVKAQNSSKKNQTDQDESMDRVTSKLSLLSDDLDISGILEEKTRGGKSDISEQMRALVQVALGDQSTREKILNKMDRLKKKQKILNFLKNQFGTSNPYDVNNVQKSVELDIDEINDLSELKSLFHIDYKNIDFSKQIKHNIRSVAGKEVPKAFKSNMPMYSNRKVDKVLDRNNQILDQRRNKAVKNIEKWTDFRKNREFIINRFCELRKKQTACKDMIVLSNTYQIYKKIFENWTLFNKQLKARNKMMFYLKLSMLTYRGRMKKFGPTLQARISRNFTSTLTFHANYMYDLKQKIAAKKVLKPFFMEYDYRTAIQLKFKNTINRVIFIQQRFRNQLQMNTAKIDALKLMWDREEQELQKMCFAKGNNEVKKYLKTLQKVPYNIKEAAFRRYISACRYKHAMAFFQWRKMYAVQREGKIDLLAVVFSTRVDNLRDQHAKQSAKKAMSAPPSSPDQDVATLTGIFDDEDQDSNNQVKFTRIKTMRQRNDNVQIQDINQVKNLIGSNVNTINSFEEINWLDPFPEDKNLLVSEFVEPTMCDLVYDECKFKEAAPPGMIFIPSKLVMRKIMKVCTTVRDFSDLYYYF